MTGRPEWTVTMEATVIWDVTVMADTAEEACAAASRLRRSADAIARAGGIVASVDSFEAVPKS